MNAITKINFHLRSVTLDDIDRVVKFLNIVSMAEMGAPEHNAVDMHAAWTEPVFNLETSVRIAETSDGQIVGYAEVTDTQPVPTRIWIYARTHPEFEGQGIGTELMDWVEERARQAIPRAPEDARVIILTDHLTGYAKAGEFLEARGMQYIRTFWHMRIDMNAEPAEPEWPAGVTIRPLVRGEGGNVMAMHEARRATFQDHWGYVEQPIEAEVTRWEHHMDRDPKFEEDLFMLAYADDQVVGISLCWAESDDDPDMGWVGMLGVVRDWRRKGLALALLQHSFREFWRRGKRSVGLGVDAANPTGATKLYEKAGMSRFREWTAYELELRPGKESTN